MTIPPRQVPPPKSPHLPPTSAHEAPWLTLAVLSLGLLVFVFITWVYLDDPEFGADEDLKLRRPVDQSATIQTPEKLRRFLESLVPFEDTTLYGKPPWLWDTPTLSRVVQSNGAALDNLRDLLEDADWHPAHSAWHAVDPCGDPRWHTALRLKQAEAAYLSRRMQEEEAFTAAIDLAEIGWRLEPLWAWPSCYQRSLEAQHCAAQTLADLLRQTKLSEATLRQFQRQFSVCQPSIELLEGAMNAFYVHEKKLILGPKSGELADTMPGGAQLQRPGRLFFKSNETIQLFANAFRQLREDAKAPLAHTSEIRLKNAPTARGTFHPNTEGQLYFTRRM
jgi:transcriptional regulator with XRE-family HTH domain